jgi:hypothetical protein
MLKFGKTGILLGVITQCAIRGFYRLGYKSSNLAVSKPAISNKKPNISQVPIY